MKNASCGERAGLRRDVPLDLMRGAGAVQAVALQASTACASVILPATLSTILTARRTP